MSQLGQQLRGLGHKELDASLPSQDTLCRLQDEPVQLIAAISLIMDGRLPGAMPTPRKAADLEDALDQYMNWQTDERDFLRRVHTNISS